MPILFTPTYNSNPHQRQISPTFWICSFIELITHGLEIEVYRKPTSTDTTIHYNSNHPIEHNLAAYRFLRNRIHQLPLTPPYKQKEWNTIQHIAKANVFPHALPVKLDAQISQIPQYHLQKIRQLQPPPPPPPPKHGSRLLTITPWHKKTTLFSQYQPQNHIPYQQHNP